MLKFSNFTLILTTDCNYSCSYCYQKKSRLYLEEACAKKAVGCFFPYFDEGCYLTFYGGEPLLAFDVIRSVVENVEIQQKSVNKNIKYSITTNGSLLSDEIIDYLDEKRFFVLLSFDAAAQNAGRKKGSYVSLVAVLDKLLEKEGIEIATNSVFTPLTTKYLKNSVRFLIKKNIPSIDISFSTLSPWENDSLSKFEKVLSSVKTDLIAYYKDTGKIPVTNFLRRDGTKVFACGAGVDRMALSPEGYLWGCNFFYDLARRQGEPLLKNSFCFGEMDVFEKEMGIIYPRVMERYKPLKMEYFFSKENFCQFCPDLNFCAICPAEAAFSTNIIGMIPVHSCKLRKIIHRQVNDFWEEIKSLNLDKI